MFKTIQGAEISKISNPPQNRSLSDQQLLNEFIEILQCTSFFKRLFNSKRVVKIQEINPDYYVIITPVQVYHLVDGDNPGNYALIKFELDNSTQQLFPTLPKYYIGKSIALSLEEFKIISNTIENLPIGYFLP